ncbi:MAG TPA: hypothetical protein VFV36_00330 [Candidatus Methylomirabilis sp.]|nr:hypothetical protein [Candidatus Methylomirabilis sp.]
MDGTGQRRFFAARPELVLSEGVCYKAGAGHLCPRESHLIIMNLDGTGRRQLTTDGFDDNYPSWGKRGILFASNRFGDWSIKIIQPDGTGLATIPGADGIEPVWAPGGDRFAFRHGAGIHEFDFRTGRVRPLVEIHGYLIPIEIMPGIFPKVISLSTTPSIQVAVRAAPGFVDDPANEVDRASLTFGRTGFEESLEGCSPAGADLLCRFTTSVMGFRPGDTIGILLAGNSAGLPLEGRGRVRIVP